MKFSEAAAFKMPLGKFQGRTLDSIAKTDQGLLYLDWLIGQDWVAPPLLTALRAYLKDGTIKNELDKALET